jgi:hypothetical protein
MVKLVTILVVCYEGCIVLLPGPFVKDGPVGLFDVYHSPCARPMRQDSRGQIFTASIYRMVHWALDFHPHSHLPLSNALVHRALLLVCRLRSCLVVCVVILDSMARKGSPMLDVVKTAEAGDPIGVVC